MSEPTLPTPTFGKSKPTSVRKPPPPRRTTSDKARADRLARHKTLVTDSLTTTATLLSGISAMTDNPKLDVDAQIIEAATPDLIGPLAEAIESSPRLSKYCDKASEVTPWVAVSIAVMGVVGSIAANHLAPLPARPLNETT